MGAENVTQLTTERPTEELAKRWAAARAAATRIVEFVRAWFQDTHRGHRLRAIPADQASPSKLARHPHTTIRLSEEQTRQAVTIERDAHVAERETTPAS